MQATTRYLSAAVHEDLQRKMVMIAGPRQVGKTTFALGLPGADRGYLTWDSREHRARILGGDLPPAPLWVLDEIHKYRRWRNWLKGLWDLRAPGQQILVTGSGRLEFYGFGGDSLQGRYHLHHMHPFSVAELGIQDEGGMRDLLLLGGFPEPLLGGSEKRARRWSREYRARLVQEDVTSLERVDDLGQLELLMLSLPERVGSPLSLNSLREDLEVNHRTVERWVRILERLCVIHRLPPFGAPRLRAVRKAMKHYQVDWSLVPEPGPRFENMLAGHLLKWVQREQDAEGRDLELRYFRDIDGREVDFVVLENRKPILLVEAKVSSGEADRGLRYLHERFPTAAAWQVSLEGGRDSVTREGIRLAPALVFLGGLA